MDADRVEHLVGEEIRKLHSSVNFVHENDDLVEGEVV